MRTWALLGILAAATAGCILDVALPDAPPVVYHADCGAKPSVLAHIAGLQASSMLIDAVNLYVVAAPGDPSKQEVWEVPKRNAQPRRLASDLAPIAGMARNGASVFLTMRGDDGSAKGEVRAVPTDGTGSPVRLATNRRMPGAVIAGDDAVYWAEEGIDPSGQTFGAIARLSVSGDGGVTTLQRMDAGDVPRQFHSFTWYLGDGGTAAWLYWTTGDPAHPTFGRGEVYRSALQTPLSPVLRIDDPDGGGAGSIEVAGGDHAQIFYAGPHGITAVTVEQDGGIGLARAFFPTGGFVGRLAEGLGYDVAYVDPSTGALTSQSTLGASDAGDTGGTTAHRLATGVDPATALEADDGCVYWIDARAGDVMMVH